MEGCCTVAISSDLSFLFPTLLQLSTEGEGLGSSFPRGHTGAVRSRELQLLGCGWGGGGTGLGAAARALPEGLTGLGEQCGRQDSWVLVLGLPRVPRLLGQGSFPSQRGRPGPAFPGSCCLCGIWLWGKGVLHPGGWGVLPSHRALGSRLEIGPSPRTSLLRVRGEDPSHGILWCRQAGRARPGLGEPSLSGGQVATALVPSPSRIPVSAPAWPREQSQAGSLTWGQSPEPQPQR